MKKYDRITAIITSLVGAWIMYYGCETLKLGSIHVPGAGLLPFLCGASLIIQALDYGNMSCADSTSTF